MAWDFSTEPEFDEKLEWMRTFVRDEIYPLETLDLDEATFRRLTDPLKEEVKKQELWAAHLDPELGGQGFGQVKLGLMHEILGTSIFAPPSSATRRPTRATPSSSPSVPPTTRRSGGCGRCSRASCAAPSR